jgi:hypothetical protein
MRFVSGSAGFDLVSGFAFFIEVAAPQRGNPEQKSKIKMKNAK